jgi:hypothetical protein
VQVRVLVVLANESGCQLCCGRSADGPDFSLGELSPLGIRDLFPGTFGYRLRHAVVSGINP